MGKHYNFMKEIEAEARAEGPEAVEELRIFHEYFSLANELIKARKAMGLSQAQLARKCKLHQSDISNIENANVNPTYRTLQTIAHGVGRKIAFVPTRR